MSGGRAAAVWPAGTGGGAAAGRRLQPAVGSGTGGSGGGEGGTERSRRRVRAAEAAGGRRAPDPAAFSPTSPAAGRGGRGRGRAGPAARLGGSAACFLSPRFSRPRAAAGRREVGGCQSGARQGWSGDGRGRQRLRGSVSGAAAAARGSPSSPAPLVAARKALTLLRRLTRARPPLGAPFRISLAALPLPPAVLPGPGASLASCEPVPVPAAGWG